MAAEGAPKPTRKPARKPTRKTAPKGPRLGVVIPVGERWDDLVRLYHDVAPEIAKRYAAWEVVVVVDGRRAEAEVYVDRLREAADNVRVVRTYRAFGEATAVMAALPYTDATDLLLLAPYYQVEPAGVGALLDRLQAGDLDMVAARRDPRVDSGSQQFQTRLFHRMIRAISGVHLQDVACGVKAMKREVLELVRPYGDQYRFLSVLAVQRGFRVEELPVPQSPLDVRPKVYRPGIYVRRALDVATMVFLFKFTEKPLRFFGLVGIALGGLGGLITAYLGVYRLLGLGKLADRPLLILSTLLLVLGVQALSIGLLGELVIFAGARGAGEPLAEEVGPEKEGGKPTAEAPGPEAK
jgi:glycosyltransferase involved in cell wall biosynthesis